MNEFRDVHRLLWRGEDWTLPNDFKFAVVDILVTLQRTLDVRFHDLFGSLSKKFYYVFMEFSNK